MIKNKRDFFFLAIALLLMVSASVVMARIYVGNQLVATLQNATLLPSLTVRMNNNVGLGVNALLRATVRNDVLSKVSLGVNALQSCDIVVGSNGTTTTYANVCGVTLNSRTSTITTTFTITTAVTETVTETVTQQPGRTYTTTYVTTYTTVWQGPTEVKVPYSGPDPRLLGVGAGLLILLLVLLSFVFRGGRR